MIVRELGFEMKAKPSERMKTEEELAKEEQARLQKLEVYRYGFRLFCSLSFGSDRLCSLLDLRLKVAYCTKLQFVRG